MCHVIIYLFYKDKEVRKSFIEIEMPLYLI